MKNGKLWLPLLAALAMTACHSPSYSPVIGPEGVVSIVGVMQCNVVRGLVTIGVDGKPHGVQAKEAGDIIAKYGKALPEDQTMMAVIPCAPPEGADGVAQHHQGETNI